MSNQLDYVDRIQEHLDAVAKTGMNPLTWGLWLLQHQYENDIAKLERRYPGYLKRNCHK